MKMRVSSYQSVTVTDIFETIVINERIEGQGLIQDVSRPTLDQVKDEIRKGKKRSELLKEQREREERELAFVGGGGSL